MWQSDDRIMDILDQDEIESKEYFPVICPICGKREGHLYAHRFKIDEDRGGKWAWCSACHNSVHVSARLPKWWKNHDLINFDRLTALPDYLEENKDCIDKWINALLFEKYSDEE